MASPPIYRYNLPGFGLVRIRLYPNVQKIFDFLEKYQHITHLKDLNQLGAIRQVLPGAHHTRYEYLMAQLAIITELCYLRGQLPAGISMGRRRRTFGEIPSIGALPTNGEILMILALLGNIGHLPTTFSGERALIKYLRDNPAQKAGFRAGLPVKDRASLDNVIRENNVFQFSYYISLFLLNRYRRQSEGNEIVEFCQNILRSFVVTKSDDPDQAIVALWNLYRNIRKITYLALDSHYAPVPFSLDLASIFLSLEDFLSDVFVGQSSFQIALTQLEGVMRDTVYMAPDQQINHAGVGEETLKVLGSLGTSPKTIGEWWTLLGPDRSVRKVFDVSAPGPVSSPRHARIVQLSYDLDPAVAPTLLPDPIGWEANTRSEVGLRSCTFAADFDPPRTHLKLSAALVSGLGPITTAKVTLRAAKQLVDFEKTIMEQEVRLSSSRLTRNGLSLLHFILPSFLGSNRRVRLRTMPTVERTPVIRERGSTRAADEVHHYLQWAKGTKLFSKDNLNEIERLEEALRAINYHGTTLAFAGSTEIIEQERIIAEFDALILLLSRDISQPTLILLRPRIRLMGTLNHSVNYVVSFGSSLLILFFFP